MNEPEYERLSLQIFRFGLVIMKLSFETDLRGVLIMLSDLLRKISQSYEGIICTYRLLNVYSKIFGTSSYGEKCIFTT